MNHFWQVRLPQWLGQHWGWVVAAGVLFRLALAPVNHHYNYNFDYRCFLEAGGVSAQGGNPYSQTDIYVYAPLGFWVMGWLHSWSGWLGPESLPHLFRAWMVLWLLLGDALIARWLRLRWGAFAGAVFWLNPLGALVTGFHGQLEPWVVALALWGVTFWQSSSRVGPVTPRQWLGMGLLGLSWMMKHSFFLLPIWLAFEARSWQHRLAALCTAPAIWLLSFVPYSDAWRDIYEQVFRYTSFNNAPTYYALAMDRWVPAWFTPTILMLCGLLIAGWVLRRRPPDRLIWHYTVWLLVLAQSIAIQYLYLPLGLVSLGFNGWFAGYSLLGAAEHVFSMFWTHFQLRYWAGTEALFWASRVWINFGLILLLLLGYWRLRRQGWG